MFKFLNKLVLIFVIVIVLFSQVSFVLAFGDRCNETDNKCTNTGEKCCCLESGGTDGVCGNLECTNVICSFSKWTSLEQLVKGITDFIFQLGIIIAPLMIVVGGFVFLTSGGEPNRTTLGKNIMKWSVIGLGIILFAWGIQSVIQFILTGA